MSRCVSGNKNGKVGTAAGFPVKVLVIKSSGFGAGAFVTVTCNRNGATFSPTDFSLSGFKAADHYGVTITGLTPTFTVQ